MKNKLGRFTVAAILAVTFLAGCAYEKTVRDAVAIARGTSDGILKVHPECSDPGNVTTPCSARRRLIAAKDTTIDLLEVYCSGPGFDAGGPCQPPFDKAVKNQAETKLRAAVAMLKTTVADVRQFAK